MRHKILLSVLTVLFCLTGWAVLGQESDDSAALSQGRWGPDQLVVMTRNIYVGGNVDRVIEAPPAELENALMLTLTELQTTNFPERAVALAKEIKWWRPHLVGLQEVSFIDIHLPDYGMVFTLDYEEILMATLKGMRLDYEMVAGAGALDDLRRRDASHCYGR